MNDRFLRLSESGIPFDPLQLTALQHWIDATDLSTVQTDSSGKVALITDKSGNGRDMAASGGTTPSVVFSDADNGLPALSMDVNTAIKATFTGITLPFTIYLYVKQTGAYNGGQVVDFGNGFTGGIGQKISAGVTTTSIILGSTNVPNSPTLPQYYKVNKWCLYCFSMDASGVVTCSIDNGPFIQYGSAGTTVPTQVQLGGGVVTGNDLMYVQEMFIFNAQPSAQQHIQICHYFFNKYYTPFAKTYIAFGDSFTLGADASNIGTTDYVSLIRINKGWDTYNIGYSGASIGYATALGSIMLSGHYRLFAISTNKSPYITFTYAANEGTVDANWKAMYKQLIQYFITLGCDPNRLCIVSPLANDTLRPLYPQITTYCSQIAAELGIKYADCRATGIADGRNFFNGTSDGLHPNDAGHAVMAATIEAALI